jgi:glucokinase
VFINISKKRVVNMDNKIYSLVDIGGTKVLMLLVNGKGGVVYREKRSTPEPAEPEALVHTIISILKDAAATTEKIGKADLAGLGVCIAGFIEAEKQVVHQSPNLNWHNPVPFGELLAESFTCPVIIENDANAAVIGEVYYGSAKGHDNVIYVTLSTGIGGGLFLNGRLYRGATGFAGEIGHIKPYGKGRECKCGGCDCLETWASGSAIAKSASLLWDEKTFKSGSFTAEDVFAMADKGNELASAIINNAAEQTGRGLANLVTLLNPSCIVIGGGVASGRPDYLKKVISLMEAYSIKPSVEITSVEVTKAQLEPEAGIWGMYALLTGRAVK